MNVLVFYGEVNIVLYHRHYLISQSIVFFRAFLEILKETDQNYIANKLRSTNIEEVQLSPKKKDGIDQMDVLMTALKMSQERMQQLEKEYKTLTNEHRDTAESERRLRETLEKGGVQQNDLMDFLVNTISDRDQIDSSFQSKRPNSELFRQISVDSTTDDIIFSTAKLVATDVVYHVIGETREYSPAAKRYQEIMRTIVDQLSQQTRGFEDFVYKVPISEGNGCQTLFGIADAIFNDGSITWSRIAVLYAFCGWMAKRSKSPGITKLIIQFLTYYIGTKLKEWIKTNEGWVRIYFFYLKYIKVIKLIVSLNKLLTDVDNIFIMCFLNSNSHS